MTVFSNLTALSLESSEEGRERDRSHAEEDEVEAMRDLRIGTVWDTSSDTGRVPSRM